MGCLTRHTPTPLPSPRERAAFWDSLVSRSLVAGLVVTFVAVAPGHAADANGNYAIRGAGSLNCETFLQALEDEPSSRTDYAEWISGYLSATNRLDAETFDASYVASNVDVATLTARICTNNRDVRVEEALASLLELMEPRKISTETELVRITLGERAMMIRQSVLDDFMKILVDQGYLDAPRDFDNTARDALIEFQEDRELPVTGLPDVNTLVRAFTS